MMLHPVFLVVGMADIVCLFMLAAAVANALKVAAHWRPVDSHAAQIDLEAGLETAGIRVRFAFWTFAFSTLVYVTGVAVVLPDAVPGAMCGTGVLQAMGGMGEVSLALRFAAFGLFYFRQVVESLNRRLPFSPLAVLQSRWLAAVFPVVFLAVFYSFTAAHSLTPFRAVDCCTVVYDRVREAGSGGIVSGMSQNGALLLSVALGLAAGGSALIVRRGDNTSTVKKAVSVMAPVTAAWAVAASIWTVTGLSSYHFQVLHHYCPWCLFLPDHNAAGFPIFISLAAVLLEGPAASIALRTASGVSGLDAAAMERCRRSAHRVLMAMGIFAVVAVFPAIVWRIRFGVWM